MAPGHLRDEEPDEGEGALDRYETSCSSILAHRDKKSRRERPNVTVGPVSFCLAGLSCSSCVN
jgi:hypothetical protein